MNFLLGKAQLRSGVHYSDLATEVLNKIFIILSKSPNFLNLRLVCQDFKTLVEYNTELKLKFNSQRILLNRIYPLKSKRYSKTISVTLFDMKNWELKKCIKKVSLDFDCAYEQNTEMIREFSSILNHPTDLSVVCNIDENTPAPIFVKVVLQGYQLIGSSGRKIWSREKIIQSLSEQNPNFRLVSFAFYSERPYPKFTKDLIKYYIKNSGHLRKLKLESVDMFETVLESAIETGRVWTFLKELHVYMCSPRQGISGGIPDEDMPFSSTVMNTFSDPTVAQRMPNLSEFAIAICGCTINLNGLANFRNLKCVKLTFSIDNSVSQEDCDSMFNGENFRQKVQAVECLNVYSTSSFDQTKRIDYIFEQYRFLRYLTVNLSAASDQNYLISSIRNGSLNHLESLEINMYHIYKRLDNQLPSLFCNDSIGTFCPRLSKLSLKLSNASSLLILQNCSEFIKQLRFHSNIKGRVGVKQIIQRLDSNQRIENINFTIDGRFGRLAWQTLKNYSKELNFDGINHRKGGTCLIKCRNNVLVGSLIWETKTCEKQRQLSFDRTIK
jgi:hypothetical protein